MSELPLSNGAEKLEEKGKIRLIRTRDLRIDEVLPIDLPETEFEREMLKTIAG